jgi:hypothetical protein
MPQQTPSRPLAEQAAQLAEAIIFELLGTPRPLELLSRARRRMGEVGQA